VTKARTNADNVTADIAGITAGTGITGGGTSGTVTITNDMATTIAAAGDLIYGTANDAYAALSLGTAGKVLKVNSGATAPEWAVDPTTDVVTTAGDLIYGTGADAVTRLGLGTAGQLLKVNSGATAPEWSTIQTGGTGFTSIGSVSATGNIVTITGLDAYNDYYWFGSAVGTNAAGGIDVLLNGNVGNFYEWHGPTGYNNTTQGWENVTNNTRFELSDSSASGVFYQGGYIFGGKGAGYKPIHFYTYANQAAYNTSAKVMIGHFTSSSVISSISFRTKAGNFSQGTFYIYGRN
jgi:hypothetical protein